MYAISAMPLRSLFSDSMFFAIVTARTCFIFANVTDGRKKLFYRYGWMEVFCYCYVATVIAGRNAGLKRIQ